LELDEKFKRLIDELGQAINDSLAESERVSEIVEQIREAGYDLFLVLELTIGFNKKQEEQGRGVMEHTENGNAEFELTKQDAKFLRALKITVDNHLQRPGLE
jgi:hypothetical protein